METHCGECGAAPPAGRRRGLCMLVQGGWERLAGVSLLSPPLAGRMCLDHPEHFQGWTKGSETSLVLFVAAPRKSLSQAQQGAGRALSISGHPCFCTGPAELGRAVSLLSSMGMGVSPPVWELSSMDLAPGSFFRGRGRQHGPAET